MGIGGAGALAAGAAIGVQTEVLPGRSWAYHRLGIDGADGTVPDVTPGPTESGSFTSEHRLGQEVGWTIARPPAEHARLPVAIVLHGRGDDHASAFDHDYLALDMFLAAAVADGTPPFALASIDGGDTYWHPRESGEDAAAMVVDEFLPLLLGRHDLDLGRLGLLGWSMGGFGALYIGAAPPAQVRAIGAMSPALWHEYADTAPGAFDDETDFERTTPFGDQDDLARTAVRIDCGEGDPFYDAVKDYRAGFAEEPAGGLALGDHDIGYWRRIAPGQVAFLGHALAGG
ncbi:alpha/beta hydrolase-fold protein [Nocardioides panacisoli]|uniref:Alpha/beta hydrolase-fold protein n=1 Tax=Nocardioides panacisoli TaxID=627624 RepID=A0ABP7IG54_9ACTN